MHRKNKTIIMFSLSLILFLSICYAVLTSNLSVNGIFSFRENVWDVHFENVLLNAKSVSKELPVISDDKLSVSFNAMLSKPFDTYEFSIDVVNNSSLDAAIQSINVTGLSEDTQNYIEYSITYNNGTSLAVNNKLFSKAVSTINIKFKYKDITLENLSNNDITISPTISINYKQDDGTAVAVANSNEWEFAYTGAEQEFNVPINGNYKLETWGAQGGTLKVDNNTKNGGYGGYSKGNALLNRNETIYVNVGGQGEVAAPLALTTAKGGYNGGGPMINSNFDGRYGASGGGATHIAKVSGLLSSLESNKEKILIVSGGGGGFFSHDQDKWFKTILIGHGGGYIGTTSTGVNDGNSLSAVGGTQEEFLPNTFGQGQISNNVAYVGAGGGYYGGQSESMCGGGGSGYIGNSLLTDKVMYCYNCEESAEESTKTISTTNVSEIPTSQYAKIGDGYVKITYIG